MSASLSDQPPTPPLAAELATPLRLPVSAETATITREIVETGRVRLPKTVAEPAETLPLDLRHDEPPTERVPVNQFLPANRPAPESRYEGDTLIIPVLREVLVKRLFLVEELRVTRQQLTASEPQTVLLRHEALHVEHLPPAAPASPP